MRFSFDLCVSVCAHVLMMMTMIILKYCTCLLLLLLFFFLLCSPKSKLKRHLHSPTQACTRTHTHRIFSLISTLTYFTQLYPYPFCSLRLFILSFSFFSCIAIHVSLAISSSSSSSFFTIFTDNTLQRSFVFKKQTPNSLSPFSHLVSDGGRTSSSR